MAQMPSNRVSRLSANGKSTVSAGQMRLRAMQAAASPEEDNSNQTPARQALEGWLGGLAPSTVAPQTTQQHPAHIPVRKDGQNWFGGTTSKPMESDAAKEQQQDVQDGFKGPNGALVNTDVYDQATFEALSPRQQSLVRAQTQLAQAIEADKETNAALNPSGLKAALEESQYSAAVASLFGDKGSEIFAPRTVAAMQALNLSPQEGDDLDNWLDGGNFLTMDQVAAVGDSAPANPQMLSAWELSNAALSDYVAPVLESGQSLLETLQGNTVDFSFVQGLQPEATNAYTEDPLNNLNDEQRYQLQQLSGAMALPELADTLGDDVDILQSQYGLTSDIIERFLRSELDNPNSPLNLPNERALTGAAFRERWDLN